MQVVVETRHGKLAGVEHRGTLLFRGVPYARPPVGPLRFQAPEPPEAWAGVREAVATGPSSAQAPIPLPLPVRALLPSRPGSEDSLVLNVWTPAADGARRPVMLWIHGGAFLFGTGASPLYSGRRLARRGDVVVVTINYRLGALGYLHLTELLGHHGPVASNCGLRDQIAALEWVRDNIEAFGGDPGNVTVFGESAGAMSTGALLGAPRARQLFHRAILQSGAAHNVSSSHQATAVAERFLDELGITPTRAGELMRLPLPAIFQAQHRTMMQLGFKTRGLPFQPAVDGDILPRMPLETLAKGDAAEIPVLIGTNRDEIKLFTLGEWRARRMDETGLRARIAEVLPGRDPDGVRRADRAVEVYRRARLGRGTLDPYEMWIAFETDRIFRYPAARLAELQAPHAPTYSYLFDWAPSLGRDRIGACHALEIPFVFGTVRHPSMRPVLGPPRRTRDLTRTLQRAWLAFAHTGDPSSGDLGAWPAYTPERRETMVLGTRSFVEEQPLEAERSFWEGRLRE